MDDLRRTLKRQLMTAMEINTREPDPSAVFLAELRDAMIHLVTYAEATRATAHPLTILAQSFDTAAPGGHDAL